MTLNKTLIKRIGIGVIIAGIIGGLIYFLTRKPTSANAPKPEDDLTKQGTYTIIGFQNWEEHAFDTCKKWIADISKTLASFGASAPVLMTHVIAELVTQSQQRAENAGTPGGWYFDPATAWTGTFKSGIKPIPPLTIETTKEVVTTYPYFVLHPKINV